MSLLVELQLLKDAATYKSKYLKDKKVASERERLIHDLKTYPLVSTVIWETENAEWARSEGLTVRYSGDIIPQWQVSIPDEYEEE